MRSILRSVLRADRPKVIAVYSVTRTTAEQAVQWVKANRGGHDIPVWCFCAEECAPVAGYERFFAKADGHIIHEELRSRWIALAIVSWCGERGHYSLKLRNCFRAPYRFLVINESGDLFSGVPLILAHAKRRLLDTLHRSADLSRGLLKASRWKVYHAGDWSWSALKAIGRGVINPVEEVCLKLFALVVAVAVQPALPRSRRRFQSLLGQSRPLLELPPLGTPSWREVLLNERKWDFAALAPLVAASHEDVLVFRQAGEIADASGLAMLLQDRNVFAAALQTEQTDWRTKLVPKFPVRQLQPGEISRTLAPRSSLMAIRRDALAEFGVPSVTSAGLALLLLCWKAAAAGLASYTLGSERRALQEVDVPRDHAAFAWNLLTDPQVRTLDPADPDLSRGNIATSFCARQPFRGNPRIMVVSPYLPFPLTHGGAVRMFNICRSLARQIDFILVCFREAGDEVQYDVLKEVFREIYVVDRDEKHVDEQVPCQISEYRNTAMRALIRHLADTCSIDAVQIEYTQMAEYADCASGRPVVLVEHDITFTLHRQIWRTQPKKSSAREFQRWLQFESKALQTADCVWTMSEHDRALALENGAKPGHTYVVPNGVDLRRFAPVPKKATIDMGPPRVLFVGAFRHMPNLFAFEAISQRIMPAVWAALPHAILHVVAGPNHKQIAQKADKQHLLEIDRRIHVDGFVEDLRPEYRDADVVAIPLPVSAGTNIKLIEAMACGRAIVSSPVGCIGLDLKDGFDLLIRELDRGFAEAIIGLLLDAEKRAEIGRNARRTAEQRFGWDRIAADALASYEALIPQSHAATA